MRERKGLHVGDRGTVLEFRCIFLSEYLNLNGMNILSDEASLVVTKNGAKKIGVGDIVTYVGDCKWSVDKNENS